MIAKLLPPKVRAMIYAVIGLAQALELIWDFIPDAALEGKVLATITALGFGLALSQTPVREA